ncbi:MAG: hypothetical protein SangKO_014260 [Sandaracinaceae bacterium]
MPGVSQPSEQGRVGVEIELGGLALERAAEIATRELGGVATAVSRYERSIETRWGQFRVELDSRPLKEIAKGWGARPSPLAELTADAIEAVAIEWVPCELVSPPMPRADLPVLDDVCRAFAEAGGRGTFDALRFAFGVHFNPELLDPRADVIRAHIQAFALLYRELVERLQVDPSRRVTPFIDPFPLDYLQRLMSEGYAPDLATLIDDYLRFNPTRNRALDMLPLFAHLDEARVRAVVPDPAVKARPTFHYRLCNSRVGDEGWSLLDEWRTWRLIETLASDPERLESARRRWRERTEPDLLDGLKAAVGWT